MEQKPGATGVVLPESVGWRTAGYPRPVGQNWGLPPMDPHIITARAYDRLSSCCVPICKTAAHYELTSDVDAAFVVDTVWRDGRSGGYVHYPVDDLLSILALESKRHAAW